MSNVLVNMDKDFELFELNKESLRRIFLKLSKNEKRLGFVDFQKLCLSGKLIPVMINLEFYQPKSAKSISRQVWKRSGAY